MTAQVDERRKSRIIEGAESALAVAEGREAGLFHVGEVAVVFKLHTDDPENHRLQMIAALNYEARREVGEPPWSELPRNDRVAVYSRCSDLV